MRRNSTPQWPGAGPKIVALSTLRLLSETIMKAELVIVRASDGMCTLGAQINFPTMDAPEALLDNQHRYCSEPMARRPLTSFAYRLLVIESFDDLIVEINRLAVFVVGKLGKVSLVGFDHF